MRDSEYESYMEDVEFYKWYKEIEKDEDNTLVLWGHILLYLGVDPQGRRIVDILNIWKK